MLQLVSYNEKYYDALNYKLLPERVKFTSSIDQCKKDGVFSDFQKSVITIMYNDEPIGFFILDKGNDKFHPILEIRLFVFQDFCLPESVGQKLHNL